MSQGRTNKFTRLFDDSMTSMKARAIFFSNIDGLSKEDRAEIIEAYQEISDVIYRRELRESLQGDFMR